MTLSRDERPTAIDAYLLLFAANPNVFIYPVIFFLQITHLLIWEFPYRARFSRLQTCYCAMLSLNLNTYISSPRVTSAFVMLTFTPPHPVPHFVRLDLRRLILMDTRVQIFPCFIRILASTSILEAKHQISSLIYVPLPMVHLIFKFFNVF